MYELVQAPNAQQAVAGTQVVIEETEWAALCQGDQPDREFRKLHCQGVHVYAIEAALGHETSRDHEPFVFILGNGFHGFFRCVG